MTELHNFISSPWGGAFMAIVLSAAVRALPEPPKEHPSLFYVWFYNFTHTLLANWDKIWFKKNDSKP